MTLIIGLAVKSLLVAGLTLGLLRLFRNASAAQHSWLAHAGLGALLLLPLVAMLIPAFEVQTGLLDTTPVNAVAGTTAVPTALVPHALRTTAATSVDPTAAAVARIDWALLVYLVPAALLLTQRLSRSTLRFTERNHNR